MYPRVIIGHGNGIHPSGHTGTPLHLSFTGGAPKVTGHLEDTQFESFKLVHLGSFDSKKKKKTSKPGVLASRV